MDKSIRNLQPPNQLAEGFLKFAKEVNQKSIDLNTKFSEEEICDIFNNSFPGKIRANFLLWIGDLNKIISGINIILSDLSDLENNKKSLKGNPVSRSEFLFQVFFGEFFRIRETSKIFIKILTKEKVLNNKGKKSVTEFYFIAFKKMYEIRNMFIHEGLSFKDYDIEFGKEFYEILSKDEQEKFMKLIKESNTRENTIEIQCAIYIKFINKIMSDFLEFQDLLSNLLADLIIEYEGKALKITVANN
ncbi:hypothetical protein [Gelidibacter salicanalis]|uniref:Uncharacterized protein n=1 Tax=Gelidibacter salicanalis TaxID=291193 RepID=A0A934KVJ6_9FLAO|nr:hypothetical protein [Gelidibacter salicanalis]MBJ7881628.1 hypothetical protein [Gelidibacter salicanalis]